MTEIEAAPLPEGISEAFADQLEVVLRRVAAHDGRLPPDSDPLSWWLMEVWDRDESDPERAVLALVFRSGPGKKMPYATAVDWRRTLHYVGELDRLAAQGKALEDAPLGDGYRKWADWVIVRYRARSITPAELMVLGRRPLWSFDQKPVGKHSRKAAVFLAGVTAVRAHYERHGHTDDLPGTLSADSSLTVDEWWRTTRTNYASNHLKPGDRAKVEKLGRIGLDLRTDKQRAQEEPDFHYRHVLRELAAYLAQHGISTLPQRGERFVNHARQWLAQDRNGTLHPRLRDALDSMEGWAWEGEDDDLAGLRAFAQTHGHVDLPRGYVTEAGEELGKRLHRARKTLWQATHNGGPARRMAEAEQRIAAAAWSTAMTELTAWHREHTTTPPPDHLTPSGFHLGLFLAYAQDAAAQAHLTWRQVKQLSQATGDSAWMEREPAAYRQAMTALTRFAHLHGHCQPPWKPTREADPTPGFVRRLERDHAAGDLSAAEVAAVEDLPGWDWSHRKRAGHASTVGRARAIAERLQREPVRTVRTDIADPDSALNRAGLRQFLPAD